MSGYDCQIFGSGERSITGIAYHSAQVRPGDLFVAIDGFKTQGECYLQEALARGAAAVALSHKLGEFGVPVVVVSEPRRFLAWAAHRLYDYPAKEIKLIGVTGTNGKTTTAWLIHRILEAAQKRTGLISTLNHFDGKTWWEATRTTPESLDLVMLLDRMRRNRVEYGVVEVSSHALALDRVLGLDFSVAVFTNLSQDHLDFHGTIDDYRAAKLKLFESLPCEALAVCNQDDGLSQLIAKRTRAKKLGYGMGPGGEVRVEALNNPLGRVRLWFGPRRLELFYSLPGRHNLYNLAAAAGVGFGLSLPDRAIVQGVEGMKVIPGRLEKIPTHQEFQVYVDYAHTPEALRNLLSSVQELGSGRVILVFGCGGERDRMKRPLMGRIASEMADRTIITTDNPRGEPAAQISAEIAAGALPGRYECISDRREAIRAGIEGARPGDLVVIAGKGHERYQMIGDARLPFDDRIVAKEILNELYG
jgi:UDP-N-acetylmuramoyl-L-alanyl-D-glutamate--2,6-diaminopimelate ligase